MANKEQVRWDASYLEQWRPLFEAIPARLAPGGFLVVNHPTRLNLLRHERPGLLHLLDDGELPGLVRGLEVLSYAEDWTDEGYHEARLVARRGDSP
jgi:tellurite methyltransferase